MKLQSVICTGLVMVMLGGCGHTQADRTISGAGIGAATGLVTGAAIGGAAGTGLLVGAGLGAAIGAVSDESKINLGRPFWK